MSLVVGMVAGADLIEDTDRLRHAGNGVVFDQIRAPSTLGTFLRAFTHGHVQQLNAVLRQTLINLARRAPLLPGAEHPFLAEVLGAVRAIAPTARIVVRADSKFYTAEVVATAARYGAAVSLTTGSNPSVNAAITQISDTAWTPIHYPNAFVDEDTGQLVSDAEVAEIPHLGFSSHPKKRQVHGRLIVRRVKRLNPKTQPRQDGLFDVWRHHAVLLTSDFEMLQAESQHCGHAIVEQVIADGAASALATYPQVLSRPTPPGRCCGQSRTTSPAPRASWPAASTPAPPPPLSAPS